MSFIVLLQHLMIYWMRWNECGHLDGFVFVGVEAKCHFKPVADVLGIGGWAF